VTDIPTTTPNHHNARQGALWFASPGVLYAVELPGSEILEVGLDHCNPESTPGADSVATPFVTFVRLCRGSTGGTCPAGFTEYGRLEPRAAFGRSQSPHAPLTPSPPEEPARSRGVIRCQEYTE